nr:peroxidase 27-like [Tanacetum cinerariifolium]
MEDETLVRILLNVVPDRYLQIVASIEQYSDLSEMTLEEAIGRLKNYEERIKYKKGKQVDNQEKLMFTQHENKGNYFRGREREKHKFSQGRNHENFNEVLLNSTKNSQAEKYRIQNLSLRGFQVIDAAKTAVEAACPGVVSCADILALVARDSIQQVRTVLASAIGEKRWKSTIASESFTLPAPFANITTLKSQFKSKGLSVKDLVILSGGHAVGISHCSTIASRLYNFTGKGDTDPTLDPMYVPHLKSKCKPTDTTTLLEMDPGSVKTFDEDYYTIVSKRRGMF